MAIMRPAKQGGLPLPRFAGLVLFLAAVLLTGADVGADALARPKSHTVVIEAMQFTPQRIEVRSGDTVVWTNKDFFPHTVTAEDHRFDSGEIAANRSWRFKAGKKGTFPYICTLHPTMKGSLVVK